MRHGFDPQRGLELRLLQLYLDPPTWKVSFALPSLLSRFYLILDHLIVSSPVSLLRKKYYLFLCLILFGMLALSGVGGTLHEILYGFGPFFPWLFLNLILLFLASRLFGSYFARV